MVVSWGVAGSTDMPPGATRVGVTLSPTSGGTRLHLVHRDLPATQTEMHGTGWDHFSSRLTMSVTRAGPGPDPWLRPASG